MNIHAPSLIPGVNAKWLAENRRENRKRFPQFKSIPEKIPLADLEATFITRWSKKRSQGWRERKRMKGADGVTFLCPLCFRNNGGPVGTHIVICWFTHVPLKEGDRDISPGPGRWNPSGTSLDDLTFVPPGSTSVALRGGCNWHGFIENGIARPA